MKKNLLLIFTITTIQVYAQRRETDAYGSKSISFGPELNVPNSSAYKTGYGVSGKIEQPFGDEFGVHITGGYNRLFLKNALVTQFTQGASVFVPVKAGVTFFWDENLYIDGDLGAVKQLNYDKQVAIAYDFGVGYLLPIVKNHGLDIGIRYERWGSDKLRETVFRVAYRFGW